MATSLDDLSTGQLKLLAEQEERSRTCAKAWVVGNEVPESMRVIAEEAYRKGWFRGGTDNIHLVFGSSVCKSFSISAVYFSFGVGLLTGSTMAVGLFLVFG